MRQSIRNSLAGLAIVSVTALATTAHWLGKQRGFEQGYTQGRLDLADALLRDLHTPNSKVSSPLISGGKLEGQDFYVSPDESSNNRLNYGSQTRTRKDIFSQNMYVSSGQYKLPSISSFQSPFSACKVDN